MSLYNQARKEWRMSDDNLPHLSERQRWVGDDKFLRRVCQLLPLQPNYSDTQPGRR